MRDARVPWDTIKTTSGAVAVGQDGRTSFFRQRKYPTLAADIPLVKGTEMLILRAEAALVGAQGRGVGAAQQHREHEFDEEVPVALAGELVEERAVLLDEALTALARRVLPRERTGELLLRAPRCLDC